MIYQNRAPLSAEEATKEVILARQRQEAIALVLLTSGPSKTLGQRIAVKRSQDGTLSVTGSFEEKEINDRAISLAESALGSRRSGDLQKSEVTTASGQTYTLFVETYRPKPELIIVGAGHIAQPLCSTGILLGFKVTVIDDRKEFVTEARFPDAHRLLEVDFNDPFKDISISLNSYFVLVTRGHKYDFECLRFLLKNDFEAGYIGMIGSRRRIRAAFIQLVNDQIDPKRISQIRAPLGLDLGAETPAEIAIAIAAELVLLSRKGDGTPLSEKENIFNRFFEHK